jgi:hypothetical protein
MISMLSLSYCRIWFACDLSADIPNRKDDSVFSIEIKIPTTYPKEYKLLIINFALFMYFLHVPPHQSNSPTLRQRRNGTPYRYLGDEILLKAGNCLPICTPPAI